MSLEDPQSDDFFILLTDALRAGPGTDPWNKAIGQLGLSSNADEARTLLDMRAELESGRSFRSVKPGPMFTHRVMAGLAGVSVFGRIKWLRWLSLKGMASVVVTSGVVAGAVGGLAVEQRIISGKSAFPSFTTEAEPATPTWIYEKFDSSVPGDWETIGTLGAVGNHGLRLTNEIRPGEMGGVVRTVALPAKKNFNLLVGISYVGNAGVTPEIFLTDDDDFANDTHELVWTVENGRPRVHQPSGRVITAGEPIAREKQTQLFVGISKDGAWVDVATTEGWTMPYVWSGLHHLDVNKPWHLGVRLAGHKYGRVANPPVVIQSISIMIP